MAWLQRRILLIDRAILIVWLSCVGFVVVYEGGTLWGRRIRATATLHAPLELKEQWFGLYYQGQKIGFAHVTISPDEYQERPGVRIVDEGHLRFNLLGVPQHLQISAQAFLDPEWRLVHFSSAVKAKGYSLEWKGVRRGDELVITLSTPQSTVTERLRDPAGSALVSGLSSWLAFRRLEVGQWGEIQILNPLALKPDAISFHVRRRERMDDHEALVIETDYHGMSATSWVTPDGQVLKESSPLGWELMSEPREVALAVSPDALSLDLLSTVAVPVDRPIAQPERLRHLVVLVEGLEGDAFRVRRRWQELLPNEALTQYGLESPSGPWCVLRITVPTVPAATAPPLEVPRRYLTPSPFVQVEDRAIRAQAQQIVGDVTDPWHKALAIHAWVYQTLMKQLTLGLPSAVDVLMTKAGDCHEHTVLFTALSRSVGIPTRMIAGLVYYDGRFYYHAWPEVWVGEWIPTDPTLGQWLADPTHIGLVEAEGEELIRLANVVGKLRVRILDGRTFSDP